MCVIFSIVDYTMRNPTRKTTKGLTPVNVMKNVVLEVVEGAKLKETTHLYCISHFSYSTLRSTIRMKMISAQTMKKLKGYSPENKKACSANM